MAKYVLIGFCWSVFWPVTCVAVQPEVAPPKVTRVERPNFSKSDWDGIYFENLFQQGLVGERPEGLALGTLTQSNVIPDLGANNSEATTGQSAWNQLISPTTLEDEIKSIQKQLTVDITTPVKFKSDYIKSHHSFSMLSMLFAIISQYGGDVRWKDDAAKAQVAFWRAASNSRVGTVQAYESCKARAEVLAEMIRGGKFTGDEAVPDAMDWASIADRNPLMHRLQGSIDRLKTATSSKGEFERVKTEIQHEAELVAAIAFAISQENMTDADDEGYREFAAAMQKAAIETKEGLKSSNYDSVSQGVNRISQSCDACHADWR
jgi:cytochrome c556